MSFFCAVSPKTAPLVMTLGNVLKQAKIVSMIYILRRNKRKYSVKYTKPM